MKKILSLMVLATFVFSLLPVNVLIADAVNDPKTVDLLAGQDIKVGEVTTWNDSENVYVKYEITDEDWCITETHVHVWDEDDAEPTNRSGNPAPGQFDYKAELDCVSEHTETVPLGDWYSDDELKIAAHAVVEKEECEILATAPYTADNVIDDAQGLRKNKSTVREGRSDPEAVLSYGLGQDEKNFFSLGFKFDENNNNALDEGGWIIIKFDHPIINGNGYDIMVVEDTWGTYPVETADIYASQDGDEDGWVFLGTADNTERTKNDIHTETYFNLEDAQMEWAKYIKVVDTTPIESMPDYGDGYDLNTIVALHDHEVCEIYDETAWADGERFTEKGNWATYFEYTVMEEEPVICSIEKYTLDIDSVNGNTGFTHEFVLYYNLDLDYIYGTGDSHAGTQTLSHFDHETTADGILEYIKFRSDYDATNYYWIPAFHLNNDGFLTFKNIDGDNVNDATGSWESECAYNLLETVEVTSENAGGINTENTLESDQLYLLVSSGTYTYNNGGDWADAEWYLKNGEIVKGDTEGSVSHVLDVSIRDYPTATNPNMDWGNYNAENIYHYEFTGRGKIENFYIHDSNHSDNNGKIDVRIYKVN